MKIIIERLDIGCVVEVQDESGNVIERGVATGKWNLYPIISRNLFEESSKKLKPKKETTKNKKRL